MGDTHRGGGPHTRRHTLPGDTPSAPHRTAGTAATPGDAVLAPVGDLAVLEVMIAAAVRADDIDTDAEQRAVAAFRAAREAGPRRARTRRRDDWRPRTRRHPRSVKAALTVLAASLTLGGVAFAAIGTSGSSSHGPDGPDGDRRPSRPAATGASGSPADVTSGSGSPDASADADRGAGPPGRPDRPAAAQDTEAHCRAWERVRADGKALDATAWQRLIAAAGGPDRVEEYCAEQLASASRPSPRPTPTAGRPTQADRPTEAGQPTEAAPSGQPDGKGKQK
ncbi:hypothetical protein C3489_13945 [Streptomyces sp. Ru71]|uniref:hypothetical protein n=1 Tax=Streptomyces sp. Ru71 TaxID=2080746 RepID=UPI000CDDBC87|nr:hypothetical protein [Streptomyces sp. Ru71]POX54228.1 hypothetical protein C3489_13945 [Streptomyces sp. Ru71]